MSRSRLFSSLGDLLGTTDAERATLTAMLDAQRRAGRYREAADTVETLLLLDGLEARSWELAAEIYEDLRDRRRSEAAARIAQKLRRDGLR